MIADLTAETKGYKSVQCEVVAGGETPTLVLIEGMDSPEWKALDKRRVLFFLLSWFLTDNLPCPCPVSP